MTDVTNSSAPNNEVPIEKSQGAELLWNEWEYRHEMFWRTLWRWLGATVTISIVPYIKPDIFDQLQGAVLVFPVIALVFAWFAAWHVDAEYARLKYVNREYRRIVKPYKAAEFDDKVHKWAKASIGDTVPKLFAIAGTLAFFLNTGLLLWILLRE